MWWPAPDGAVGCSGPPDNEVPVQYWYGGAVAVGLCRDPDGPHVAGARRLFVDEGVVEAENVAFVNRSGVVAGLPSEGGCVCRHDAVQGCLGQADGVTSVDEALAASGSRVDGGQAPGSG